MSLPLSEWTSEDASVLKLFLGSDTAKKAFALVADAAPELLDGADVNKTLVRSGVVLGYNLSLNNLFELTVHKPEEVKTPESYPPLDDESAWEKPETTK